MVNDNLAYKFDNSSNEEVVINEAPLKWCSVTLSDVIVHGKRLEASSYDVDSKRAVYIIKQCKYGSESLMSQDGLVETAHHAPRFKRNYVSKNHPNSVGFLGSSEMLDVKPEAEKYITKDLADKLNLFANKNTVLMSCSGTIGRISYVTNGLSSYALSQHIIRIICKEYSGYIYTCLSHKLMQKQIQALIYGAVIQEIEPEHLKAVIIPNAPSIIKQKIHTLITESYRLRDESNELIDEATRLLIEELQLPPIEELSCDNNSAPVETFNVKLSELEYRVDASYHVPIVNKIVAHLREHAEEVTTIADERISSDVVLPGRFKRVYVEDEYGVKFLGGKEINQLDPSSEKYLSKNAHSKQLEGALGIKANSILTPARGSLGEVVLPCKHFLNWAISDNMMQILSKEDICGYVYIFLNSDYGKALIQRFTYGGVVDAIEPWHIQQVQIPLLKNKEIQARINELALQANQKRYEAYLLEQRALKVMDDEVIYAK